MDRADLEGWPVEKGFLITPSLQWLPASHRTNSLSNPDMDLFEQTSVGVPYRTVGNRSGHFFFSNYTAISFPCTDWMNAKLIVNMACSFCHFSCWVQDLHTTLVKTVSPWVDLALSIPSPWEWRKIWLNELVVGGSWRLLNGQTSPPPPAFNTAAAGAGAAESQPVGELLKKITCIHIRGNQCQLISSTFVKINRPLVEE